MIKILPRKSISLLFILVTAFASPSIYAQSLSETIEWINANSAVWCDSRYALRVTADGRIFNAFRIYTNDKTVAAFGLSHLKAVTAISIDSDNSVIFAIESGQEFEARRSSDRSDVSARELCASFLFDRCMPAYVAGNKTVTIKGFKCGDHAARLKSAFEHAAKLSGAELVASDLF